MTSTPTQDRLYDASWGGVRLWLSGLDTDESNTVVEHQSAKGSRHVLQARGKNIVHATASVLFDFMDGDDLGPFDRLTQFRGLIGDGTIPQMLTHPTLGTYLALVGKFTHRLDEHTTISGEVEFIRADDPADEDAIEPGETSIPPTGTGAVDVAAESYRASLKDAGLDDPGYSQEAQTAVDKWTSDGDANPRIVGGDIEQLTAKLGAQAALLEASLDYWPAYWDTIILMDAVFIAGEAALSSSSASGGTFAMRISVASSLRNIVTREYGADRADEMYALIMQLNDIPNPLLIPAGTVLQCPTHTPSARYG